MEAALSLFRQSYASGKADHVGDGRHHRDGEAAVRPLPLLR
jgi:hypothetical protein